MTSAIRTSALISPVFTCEMASASRRTCNIRCFMQLFVVNMIARPMWAKDVKFGVLFRVFVTITISRHLNITFEINQCFDGENSALLWFSILQ